MPDDLKLKYLNSQYSPDPNCPKCGGKGEFEFNGILVAGTKPCYCIFIAPITLIYTERRWGRRSRLKQKGKTMKYRTILIDPPWPKMKTGSLLVDRGFRSAIDVYPTMSIEDISKMPVQDIAEVGAHLWVWVTDGMLPNVFDLIKQWGFKYHAPIIWHKKSGTGNYFIHETEFLIFAYFRKCFFNRSRFVPNHYQWPTPSVHSRKPEGSYDLIESISDPERIELFARPLCDLFPERPGWRGVGNQMNGEDITSAIRNKEMKHVCD